MGWYLVAFKKYAVFSGRSSRKEFWYFVMGNMMVNLLLSLLFFVQSFLSKSLITLDQLMIVVLVFNFLILSPTIGVSIRRLHDINRSGWFIFLNVIPVFGTLLLIFLLSLEGSIGDNRFGEDPSWITSRSAPITI
ncbi:DUF805 domain-containing protein [Marinomonas spartinae]|uniref:DUF805 domain-containing protein n=1 Tax=Marinomonas spartinae TaxID=1792290 RepID=UPI0018F1CE53|nr:DUF805 domain-containing protein [Marinomonas spartinae]MBJ7554088.1 DUF805 domain-containing protein [Marinomonas spartinae]